MATSKRAPRELDPFAKGKIANMHADIGDAYRAVSLYEEAVREYEQALALCPTFVDIRTELGNTRREMGDLTGAIRELERVRAESPRFVAGRLKLGLVYYAAARRDDAAAEWRAVLAADPDESRGEDVPRAARSGGRRRTSNGGRRACSPSRRRPIGSSSRSSPPTRPPAKARTPSCWLEKRGLTTFDAIAPGRGGVRRRGARHRLRGDEGQAGDDAPVAERARAWIPKRALALRPAASVRVLAGRAPPAQAARSATCAATASRSC